MDNGWISVLDRFPDNERAVSVIVWEGGLSSLVRVYRDVVWYNTKTRRWDSITEPKIVTHWQEASVPSFTEIHDVVQKISKERDAVRKNQA